MTEVVAAATVVAVAAIVAAGAATTVAEADAATGGAVTVTVADVAGGDDEAAFAEHADALSAANAIKTIAELRFKRIPPRARQTVVERGTQNTGVDSFAA